MKAGRIADWEFGFGEMPIIEFRINDCIAPRHSRHAKRELKSSVFDCNAAGFPLSAPLGVRLKVDFNNQLPELTAHIAARSTL